MNRPAPNGSTARAQGADQNRTGVSAVTDDQGVIRPGRARKPLNAADVLACRLGGQGRATRDLLKLIPEAIEEAGPFAFVFDVEPPRYVRDLLDTLGVDVIVDQPGGRLEVRRAV